MNRLLLGTIILIILNSCQNGPNQQEFDNLTLELENCKKENEELKNTPENRLLVAQKLENDGHLDSAETEYKVIFEKFPKSEEAKIAEEYVDKAEKEREQQKIEEERKKRLGFKILKQQSTIKQGDSKLEFSNIKLSDRWIFDRYGNEWRYIEAERGNKYLTLTLSVTADTKSPSLPPIYVYQLIDGKLQYQSTVNYKFFRWDDYASYLGNDADYNNDFSRTATIRFSPGAEIVMDNFNNYPTFLMVKKSNCVYRTEDRFERPPVSYSSANCNYDRALDVDMANNDYFTVEIFNENKI